MEDTHTHESWNSWNVFTHHQNPSISVMFCVLFSCCDYDAIRFPIQKQNKKKRANKQNTIKDDDSCCCCRAYGVRISRPAARTNEYATYHIQQKKKQNEKKIKNRAAILLYFM